MRAADITTIARMLLVAAVAYFVLIKFSAIYAITLFVIAIVLDAIDGYLAVWQASSYKLSFSEYIKASVFNDRLAKERVNKYKKMSSKKAKFGPRMDVAGDRFVEYTMWITFTIVGIIPLWIVIAVIMRHSIADALMAARGTSSRMRSKFGRIVYASNISRAGINIVKVLTFGYLILMYISAYPAIIGYALVGILFVFVMVRGVAEIYEGTR